MVSLLFKLLMSQADSNDTNGLREQNQSRQHHKHSNDISDGSLSAA